MKPSVGVWSQPPGCDREHHVAVTVTRQRVRVYLDGTTVASVDVAPRWLRAWRRLTRRGR